LDHLLDAKRRDRWMLLPEYPRLTLCVGGIGTHRGAAQLD
jgi:hypothetical protein